jgi:hypothetical protein
MAEKLRMMVLTGEAMVIRIHINGRAVIIIRDGMPSGDFLTALKNSIGHLETDACVWIIFWNREGNVCEVVDVSNFHLVEHHAKSDLETVSENTQIMHIYDEYWLTMYYTNKLGDDSISSIAEVLATSFTPEKKAEIWEELGYSITDAKKTGTFKWTPFEELQYLKCTFKRHPFYPWMHRMAIDLSVVDELTNWVRKGQPAQDALDDNLQDCLRFLVAHGETTFNQYLKEINAALTSIGQPEIAASYQQYEQDYMEQDHQLPWVNKYFKNSQGEWDYRQSIDENYINFLEKHDFMWKPKQYPGAYDEVNLKWGVPQDTAYHQFVSDHPYCELTCGGERKQPFPNLFLEHDTPCHGHIHCPTNASRLSSE